MKMNDMILKCTHSAKLQPQSAPHAEVTSDDPFLALEHLAPFMQHALRTVAVQEGHSDLELAHDGFGRRVSALLLGRVGVEDCFAAQASGSRRSQIQ